MGLGCRWVAQLVWFRFMAFWLYLGCRLYGAFYILGDGMFGHFWHLGKVYRLGPARWFWKRGTVGRPYPHQIRRRLLLDVEFQNNLSIWASNVLHLSRCKSPVCAEFRVSGRP
jgi:hypothetical protein